MTPGRKMVLDMKFLLNLIIDSRDTKIVMVGVNCFKISKNIQTFPVFGYICLCVSAA